MILLSFNADGDMKVIAEFINKVIIGVSIVVGVVLVLVIALAMRWFLWRRAGKDNSHTKDSN